MNHQPEQISPAGSHTFRRGNRLVMLVLTLAIVLASFQFGLGSTQAVSSTFTISQFQVAGATASDEFIELHNVSNVDQVVPIHEIQGAQHTSPYSNTLVSDVTGIVTAMRSNGFYMQDPMPDNDAATSEAIFVFTSSAPSVNVGDAVTVSGRVTEFRPGGSTGANLSTTQISNPNITTQSSGNALPPATVVGTGGRVPPQEVIEDNATGSVEASGTFDPATDGIDFYESLEGMLLQVNDAVAVGPTNNFGEIVVLPDNGANATVRTPRGGIIIRPNDFNPERIIIDDAIVSAEPQVNVGDRFGGAITGVLDYSFGAFKLLNTQALPAVVPGGLTKETTEPAGLNQLAVATFNVENLDPGDGAAKFNALAQVIVSNLKAPDLIALEEIQDNNGPTNDSVTNADVTYNTLIAAITTAGGPTYQFRQIDPVDDQDGGEPGGNIRVGFLFRTDRGLAFVDRPGGGPMTATTVVDSGSGPRLSFSPGRIDPSNPAFNRSRKPLAGEFTYNGRHLFVIANHFTSKGGDQPLFGRFQPPARSSEVQRTQQAQIVNNFVDGILAVNTNANIVVLGDLNDFEFSAVLNTVKGGVLTALIDTLPENERYTYVFEGNSQTLDHMLVSSNFLNSPFTFDVVHVNAEFSDQISDHDPQVGRFTLAEDAVTPTATMTTSVPTGTPTATTTATVTTTSMPRGRTLYLPFVVK